MTPGTTPPARRVLLAALLSLGVAGGTALGCWPHSSATPAAIPVAATPAAEPAPAPAAAATPVPVVLAASSPASQVDLKYVRAAQRCPGLDPAVLAAIHTVETRRGHDGRASSAGAIGPMQFLPATWKKYGADGDGDGRADIHDLTDALAGAARLLCANGGADRSHLADAVWNYNHSRGYVAVVLRLADRITAGGV